MSAVDKNQGLTRRDFLRSTGATLVAAAAFPTTIPGAATATALGAEPSPLFSGQWSMADQALQRDFPDLCLDREGTPWLVYIEYDGKADVLRLARKTASGLENVALLAGPGVFHQPAIARDGSGALWCFWGQLGPKRVMNLYARRWADGTLDAPQTLAESAASDTFADAGTDPAGRVWVAWQSLRRGTGDIYARYYEPKSARWSAEIAVSAREGSDWEPRLAFDGRDGAWVAFDSARGDEFNLYLAHVALDGHTETRQLTRTPTYEGRVSMAAAPDGKGLWLAAERGRQLWGKDARMWGTWMGEDVKTIGMNSCKRILCGYYDIAANTFTELPPATPVLKRWAAARKAAQGKTAAQDKPAFFLLPGPTLDAVNLPILAVDTQGNPWLACRYYPDNRWHLAVMKFDAARKSWSLPTEVPDSTFGQDRRCKFVAGDRERLWLCWPSDRRPENWKDDRPMEKRTWVSGVFLAALDTPAAPADAGGPAEAEPLPPRPQYMDPVTPERPRGDRHFWTFAHKKYRLCWGDVHRHTDISRCITAYDGCALEHFRYALDAAGLDFMGTSDHSEPTYGPYEWWCNARLTDVFHIPGEFASLYVYERSQNWPWGHRNMIFAERGAPIVYVNRQRYKNSVWQARYPVGDGPEQIMPEEMWRILRQYGQPLAVISHTGATTMGTDWELLKHVDGVMENLVEIYQGCRVSCEGQGDPQPTVGILAGKPYGLIGLPRVKERPPNPIVDFAPYNRGLYHNALRHGQKFGVFASSDHISQNVSFGGVYTDDFTREGLIRALNARQTIAATDKIYLEFSCNGHLLGSIFETGDKPCLTIRVNGTAPIQRVTLVRNELDYQAFDGGSRDFTIAFTDPSPVDGENRYYIHVQQNDGNMAWASPVWVTYKKT